jgi:hypothetical protein
MVELNTPIYENKQPDLLEFMSFSYMNSSYKAMQIRINMAFLQKMS